MILNDDVHFICPRCKRTYKWKEQITGHIFDKKKYCIPCFLVKVTDSGTWKWETNLKILRRYFDIDVYPTGDPEVLEFTVWGGGAPVSATINVTDEDGRHVDGAPSKQLDALVQSLGETGCRIIPNKQKSPMSKGTKEFLQCITMIIIICIIGGILMHLAN